jgi:hypothetical protein
LKLVGAHVQYGGIKLYLTLTNVVQELGGDYGLQRFVGNFGAIVFAPVGGYLIGKLVVYTYHKK